MTQEEREQLEFIQRCDPSLLIHHIKESTNFDAKLMESVFDLAKSHARMLLAADVKLTLEMFMTTYRCKGWEGDVAYQRAQVILEGMDKS
ncbi:hypothetical protein [Burkholderia vietnamiensis]|uniref:hypothetical protein n=1 Tax=Burkholderia vietnamiensis TaxID=60552 RepID=UPI001CAE2337|nr:hypothetical protein [Burkholderia vietnamiensis]CAG9229359.1 hypothetical protein BVI1335_70197 [Burkholderia vietnamiensis]